MALRIVRAMQFQYSPFLTRMEAGFIVRFMYEFWGYVIHAPASQTTPGGFPGVAFNTFPANSLEGSTVLATGSDGATAADQTTFTSASANFTTSMVNKYLVVWSSTTPGQEDGIYKILGRNSATQLVLNVNNGGSAHPVSRRPRFTTRTGLRYRVADIEGMQSLPGWATGQYIVFQMTPSISNPGQANSQVQVIIRNASSGIKTIGMVGSPGGTWNGSAFTDGMTEVTHTTNGQGMFPDSLVAPLTDAQISMFGDRDGMIAWFRGNGNGGYVHFEAPFRLPTQAQDPNPLLIGADGLSTLHLGVFSNGYNNWWMRGTDGTSRRHRMIVKCLSGDGNGENGRPTGTVSFFGDARVGLNQTLKRTFLSKVLIGQIGTPSTQFTLARSYMRYARICPNVLPPWIMLGENDEWLHIQNGICFPWDGVFLGSNLIPLGY
jgi:hypothetical protein